MYLSSNLQPQILFKNVGVEFPVLVAVSGGSDSIALLLLANAWAQNTGVMLHVATVNHGLRKEAEAEVCFVASLCKQLGLQHTILQWQGQKPSTGVSKAARSARYELLESLAHEIGAKSILVGHQADDQAETLMMRSARESAHGQKRGLSGMANISRLPHGSYLHRPLLNVSRRTLKAYLNQLHQKWVEDPSNHDLTYERVRVRLIHNGDDEFLNHCTRFSYLIGRVRHIMNKRAVAVLEGNLEVLDGPVFKLPVEALLNIEPQIQELVLQILVSMAGGGEYFSNVDVLLPMLSHEGNYKKTLGGAIIERRKSELCFYRENRNILAKTIEAGQTILWDGRFRIENRNSSEITCQAFGQIDNLAYLNPENFKLLSHTALNTTLCIHSNEGLFFLPFVRGSAHNMNVGIVPVYRAIEHFCAETDFVLLEFIQNLRNKGCFKKYNNLTPALI